MTKEQALLWLWDLTKNEAAPFHGSSELGPGDVVTVQHWSCWGCDGEFSSRYVLWKGYEEPTDETFGHESNCKYLAVKKLIDSLREPTPKSSRSTRTSA